MKKDTISKIILIAIIAIVAVLIIVIGIGICKELFTSKENPIATIEVENFGTIKVELYPDKAPNTVSNFITLANRGYYNGLTFHRVVPGFMIQGGAKNADGTGSATLGDLKGTSDTTDYAIEGEMIANGYSKNTLKMQRGVIAMSRADYTSISSSLTTESYNSAGSQFFIMHEDMSSIDGVYTGFGRVIEGMDVVDKIVNVPVTYRSDDMQAGDTVPTDENGKELTADMPLEKPVIKSITVDTHGVDYGEPKTIEPFNYYNFLMQYYNSLYGNQ